MKYQYTTQGTCSRSITFDIDPASHRVSSIAFIGGCNGNLKGIAALTEGMKAEDIIERIRGVKCGNKNTSCPDQLACALTQALADIKG